MLRPILPFILALAALATSTFAAPAKTKKGALTVELLAEDSALVPGGKTSVGILLKHDPGWHTYSEYPGIVGMTPRLTWDLPQGVTAGPVQWAMPERTKMGPYRCYGYEKDALHIIELTADETLKPDATLSIKLNVFWLICADRCIVNDADVELSLPVALTKEKNNASAAIFKTTREAWPRSAEGWKFEAKELKDHYTLAFTPPKDSAFQEKDIHFINLGTQVHSDKPQELEKHEDGSYTLTLQRFDDMAGKPERFKGILLNGDGWSADGALKAISVDTPLDRSAVETESGEPEEPDKEKNAE